MISRSVVLEKSCGKTKYTSKRDAITVLHSIGGWARKKDQKLRINFKIISILK